VVLILGVQIRIRSVAPELQKDKDLSRVKPEFKSFLPNFFFEIARLASAEKWREIQNLVGRNAFKAGFYPAKIFKVKDRVRVMQNCKLCPIKFGIIDLISSLIYWLKKKHFLHHEF